MDTNAVSCRNPGYTRRNPPARQGDGGRYVALEPVNGMLLRELGHHRRCRTSVYWATHERHAARLGGVSAAGHQRDGRNHRRRWLAHGHHVRIGAEVLQEADDRLDIAVEVEVAMEQRHDAGVPPVRHEHLVPGVEQVLHRPTQQCRVVAAHRRHQQHAKPARRRRLEPDEAHKGPVEFDLLSKRFHHTAALLYIPRGLAPRPQQIMRHVCPCDGGARGPSEGIWASLAAKRIACRLGPHGGRNHGGCSGITQGIQHKASSQNSTKGPATVRM